MDPATLAAAGRAALALLKKLWWATPILAIALIVAHFQLGAAKRSLGEATRSLAAERAAHAQTVSNFRLASEQAQRAAEANAKRVLVDQQRITEGVSHDYQAQLADVRARADALRVRIAKAAADTGGAHAGGASAVPEAAGGPDGATAQEGLPAQGVDGWALEDRVTATEQALQLEALQRWVREQSGIDFNDPPPD